MKLEVLRFSSGKDDTLGLLFIDGAFECFTLEDEARTIKKYGETRIPDGTYRVSLRDEGGFHNRYLRKFGEVFHKGMLHVENVPNFKYILIHIGNDEGDTAGCLLVGDSCQTNVDRSGFIGSSTGAYKDMYAKVRDAILAGEPVHIHYRAIA